MENMLHPIWNNAKSNAELPFTDLIPFDYRSDAARWSFIILRQGTGYFRFRNVGPYIEKLMGLDLHGLSPMVLFGNQQSQRDIMTEAMYETIIGPAITDLEFIKPAGAPAHKKQRLVMYPVYDRNQQELQIFGGLIGFSPNDQTGTLPEIVSKQECKVVFEPSRQPIKAGFAEPETGFQHQPNNRPLIDRVREISGLPRTARKLLTRNMISTDN